MRRADLTLPELLDRLVREDATVLLPTAAAAARLRRAFGEGRRNTGLTAWQPPRVFSWSQWTGTLWTELVLAGYEERLLMNPAQEQSLWIDLLAEVPATLNITVPAAALAELAQSAWSLAASFRGLDRLRRSAASHDPRLFAQAADRFATLCNSQRLLSPALLEAALAQHLAAGHQAIPQRLLLCDFGSLLPSQSLLVDSLESRGVAIETLRVTQAARAAQPQPGRARLPDLDSELRFALAHLRNFLTGHPGSTAALIVPDVSAESSTLEPALREQLAPQLQDIYADAAEAPWAFSKGRALASVPAIAAILTLARWMRGPLPLDTISALLRSPALTAEGEAPSRARFCTAVLDRQVLLRPELDLGSTLRLAGGFPELRAFLERMQGVAAQWKATPARRSHAEWTEAVRRLARAAGWPGPRTPNAEVQAALDKFDGVLDLVATLDFSGRRISAGEALLAIEQRVAAASSPSGSSEAPLQILTLTEARGLHFDAAVVLRATDSNLPAAIQPHPLLEWTLQRSLGMPGATPEAAEAAVREALADLLAATPEVLFTHAAEDEDGALRVSPLACLFAPNALAVPAEDTTAAAPASVEKVLVADDVELPHPPEKVRGGASALKLQSACGFRAFAEIRLGGRELAAPEPGFSASEAGTLLHAVLNAFWAEVRTKQNLVEMTTQQRSEAIDRAIDAAVSERPGSPFRPERAYDPNHAWDQAFLSVTRERLHRILPLWLRFEMARGPFTVQATEQKSEVGIGPLFLDVRMDRVDSVPDGNGGFGVVFIDYKTGSKATPALWQGPRPDDPQLPLYALNADPDSVRGIAFGRIRPGKDMGFHGWAAEPDVLPLKRDSVRDLSAAIAEWRHDLEVLASDFYDSKAAADPKSYAENCIRCSQRLLCRVDAAALMAREADDLEGEDGGVDG